MRTFDFVIAWNDAQVADAQRLRWLVYGEEERMLPSLDVQDGCDGPPKLVDDCDRSAATAHILVYAGSEAVGTARLTQLSSSGHGPHPEASILVQGIPTTVSLAIVERFCILRRFRNTRVVSALHRGLTAASRQRGVDRWLAVGNTQTDCPLDAALAYRVAEEEGLLTTDARAHARVPQCPRLPCTRHIYTAAQRQQAVAGHLAGLRLPRTLTLFAKRMGGRYAGSPIYDSTLNIFGLPLIAEPIDL